MAKNQMIVFREGVQLKCLRCWCSGRWCRFRYFTPLPFSRLRGVFLFALSRVKLNGGSTVRLWHSHSRPLHIQLTGLAFWFFDANRANDVCFCVSSDNKEEEEGEVK